MDEKNPSRPDDIEKVAPSVEEVENHYEALLQGVQQELKDMGYDISRETVEFVIGHFFSGFHWILSQTSLEPTQTHFRILDLKGSNASIIQDLEAQETTLVISPNLFVTSQQAIVMAHENDIEPSDMIVDLDLGVEGIPAFSYSLEDHIQSIGVEEGTHWIQGFVSRGQEIPGFVESGLEENIHIKSGESVDEAVSRFQLTKATLDNLLQPDEMNARFWINEFFKHKKSDENTFEEFYKALVILFEKRKNEKNSPISVVKNFFTGKKKK